MMIKFVAEVSSNHNKSLARSLSFIDTAAEIGCWGVKFQLFKIEELFVPEALLKNKALRDRKQWELPVEFIPEISERCRRRRLKFICTPFYLKAVEELKPYVDIYKIASYELLWHSLLKKCAETERPVILSTGMAQLDEVADGVKTLISGGCRDITVLHCVSAYPARPEECNLSAIEAMRSAIKVSNPFVHIRFGWSDHSLSEAVILRAAHRWKAEIIEFHMDLDGEGKEFKMGFSWLPGGIEKVIKSADIGISADGNGIKQPAGSEAAERDWRADPKDGLRPVIKVRRKWGQEKK